MDFNSLSYFQPHEIYGIDLVKFVFLELSSNYFLFFFFLRYCSCIVLDLVMVLWMLLLKLYVQYKKVFSNFIIHPNYLVSLQIPSYAPTPFSIPTFWFSMWKRNLIICIFTFSLILKQVVHRFPFERTTLKKNNKSYLH